MREQAGANHDRHRLEAQAGHEQPIIVEPAVKLLVLGTSEVGEVHCAKLVRDTQSAGTWDVAKQIASTGTNAHLTHDLEI